MKDIGFTNVDKIFWPQQGYTKGDMIAYYDAIADTILPYLINRPLVLNRYPDGVRGKHFFQKNIALKRVPRFIRRVSIRAQSGKIDHYAVCNNRKALLWLANFGTIELHPWGSRVGSLHKPDFFILDIDPGGAHFEPCVDIAQEAHRILEKARVVSTCKTSGKSGLHVYVPLRATYSFNTVRRFGTLLARVLHERFPSTTTLEQHTSKRHHRIYLDVMRNSFGQTAVAPYSLRPTKEATVSTPLEWKEVSRGLNPRDFTIKTIPNRLKKKGDLWNIVLGKESDLAQAIRILEKELV